jgi:hypothetical protein
MIHNPGFARKIVGPCIKHIHTSIHSFLQTYIYYVLRRIMTTLTSLAGSALAYVEGVGLVGKQPLRGSHKQSEGAGQHD